MARVGLVGGLGPESTIDYYRRIQEAWGRERPGSAPAIVIDSLDVQVGLKLVEHDRPGLIAYLEASIARLAGAGADFAALTANSPHLVFDELAQRSALLLISIVETCAAEAKRRGFGRLLLLGTRFTMEGAFFPAVFARHGLRIVTLDPAGVTWVHERYVGELLQGVFLDGTREAFVERVARARRDHGINAVILGGTELPLLLRAPDIEGVPLLDTTALHVEAIVARLR